MKKLHLLLLATCTLFVLSCSALFPAASTPLPDLLATFQASTPGTLIAPAETVIPNTQQSLVPTPIPGGSTSPGGRIVYTCNVYKADGTDQICMVNADGTGFRQFTKDSARKHYYPSFAPDGQSIVYAAFLEANVYEIYEMNLADGSVKQLTDRLGVLNAPEISPDGTRILFMHWIAARDRYEVWIMRRDGGNPHRLIDMTAWDPTWSPDGSQVLFASNRGGTNQLWIINLDGSDPQKVSDLPDLRGRSDWSALNQIVTYSGPSWEREIYIMNTDGSDQHRISPPGGNGQGPAFSPDGQWVTFTAYYDHFKEILGCEIYIMRTDGSDLRRLTDNDYCDYQPRWGP